MRSLVLLLSLLVPGMLWAENLPIDVMISPGISQNAYDYISKTRDPNEALISEQAQKKLSQLFLQHYFSAWHPPFVTKQFCITANNAHCQDISHYEAQYISDLKNNHVYDVNYNLYPPAWAEKINENMDLSHFPNINCGDHCLAITTNNTAVRELPTLDPAYASIKKAGEGYPFDNLQDSNLWLGSPLQIIQQTKDKKWYLVKSAAVFGWVKASDVAKVDAPFIRRWEQSPLSVTTSLKTSLNKKDIYFGSLLPYEKRGPHSLVLFYPVKNAKNFAQLYSVTVAESQLKPWPVKATANEFSREINLLLGMSYGWGDLDNNTDCSATLKRLFASFGIWLPRQASAQAAFSGAMHRLPIEQYSIDQRKSILRANPFTGLPKPQPYLTLISFQDKGENDVGHVALYIASDPKSGQVILFQSIWALSVLDQGRVSGRAIIGKAVLTDMSLGENLNLGSKNLSVESLW